MMIRVRGVAAVVLCALTGCVAPLPPQQAQVPLIAVPGPGKTQARFDADDASCRAEAGRASIPTAGTPAPPAQAGAEPTGPAALPSGMVYLRCMEARTNVIQPLPTAAPPVLYATYAPYPIYAAYGPYGFYGYDPLFGGPFGYGYGFGIGFGVGFGFGGYGRYYGGYGRFGGYERGGYGGYGRFGGGYGGGFREGGFGRGGGYGGGGYGGGGGHGGGYGGGGGRR